MIAHYPPHSSPNLLIFKEKTLILLLMSIAVVLIFAGIGLRDPWPADEPRFALIAKEMVETGQWFFPARAGEFYPDKPPIFMWAIAIFYAATGSLNFAFLLPSALCALLTVYLVFDIAKKLWSTEVGFIAGMVLIFSLQFMLQAKTAQIDAMVTCWITVACYGLLRFTLHDGKWFWYYLAWFFMGLGVITKGVGFLPLLMLLPYAYYRNSKRYQPDVILAKESALKWALGPIVMLLAIGLWFFPMLYLVEISHNPLLEQYRDNILLKQTVTRYADSWHHIKPFWYYIVAVIPVFWLPLSFMLPWLIPKWLSAIKTHDGRIILPLGWIVLVLLFFSISPGKRGVYVLPALPMLVLIAAPYIRQLVKKRALNWLLWGTVVTLASFILLFGMAGVAGLNFAVKLEEKFAVAPWACFIAIGVCGLTFALLRLRNRQWQSWPLFITALWLIYSTWGYLLLNEAKTPKNIFREMAAYVPQDAEIALVDFSEQFILFSPYQISHFGYHSDNKDQIKAAFQWQGKADNRYILLDYALLTDTCFNKQQAIHLGFAHRTDWVLLAHSSRRETCEQTSSSLVTYHYRPK